MKTSVPDPRCMIGPKKTMEFKKQMGRAQQHAGPDEIVRSFAIEAPSAVKDKYTATLKEAFTFEHKVGTLRYERHIGSTTSTLHT